MLKYTRHNKGQGEQREQGVGDAELEKGLHGIGLFISVCVGLFPGRTIQSVGYN
jgi:hypothetical protein